MAKFGWLWTENEEENAREAQGPGRAGARGGQASVVGSGGREGVQNGVDNIAAGERTPERTGGHAQQVQSPFLWYAEHELSPITPAAGSSALHATHALGALYPRSPPPPQLHVLANAELTPGGRQILPKGNNNSAQKILCDSGLMHSPTLMGEGLVNVQESSHHVSFDATHPAVAAIVGGALTPVHAINSGQLPLQSRNDLAFRREQLQGAATRRRLSSTFEKAFDTGSANPKQNVNARGGAEHVHEEGRSSQRSKSGKPAAHTGRVSDIGGGGGGGGGGAPKGGAGVRGNVASLRPAAHHLKRQDAVQVGQQHHAAQHATSNNVASTPIPVTPLVTELGDVNHSQMPQPRIGEGAHRTPSQANDGSTCKKKRGGAGGGGCKKCNCKKSRCLKLYCECFAAGVYCDNCNCQNCLNTVANAELVESTRKQIEVRNPQAFKPKIIQEEAGNGVPPPPGLPIGVGGASRQGFSLAAQLKRHKKGCHCKKSHCLKKYCECFQAGVKCTELCKCVGCKNCGPSPDPDKGGNKQAVTITTASATNANAKTAPLSAVTVKHQQQHPQSVTAKEEEDKVVVTPRYTGDVVDHRLIAALEESPSQRNRELSPTTPAIARISSSPGEGSLGLVSPGDEAFRKMGAMYNGGELVSPEKRQRIDLSMTESLINSGMSMGDGNHTQMDKRYENAGLPSLMASPDGGGGAAGAGGAAAGGGERGGGGGTTPQHYWQKTPTTDIKTSAGNPASAVWKAANAVLLELQTPSLPQAR